MKHAKPMNTINEIFIKINFFSLGIYQILVLFGNAEFMSVVKYGNKSHIAMARTIRQLEREQNSAFACLRRSRIQGARSRLRSTNTPAFPPPRGSAPPTTN